MYARYLKRSLDLFLSFFALIILSPLFLVIAILVYAKHGSPVLFKQARPGRKNKDGREKLFTLYKFRTMTDARDKDGRLLPDEIRLTPFGAWLRSSSLDELPELINIIRGDMSVVGPRPQLVRDMVFMSDEQRMRHNVRPGLTGLAQVRGRNSVSWDEKLKNDLVYIDQITLIGDMKIILQTMRSVYAKEGITANGMATAEDLGDYLLRGGMIAAEHYSEKKEESKRFLITKQS